jgi:hypothetical protein
MPYTIIKTDGSVLADILDNSVDKLSTDLTLVGKSTNNYGLEFNQNFVKLLENFASTTAPKSPIKGQIWYDTSEEKIRIFNGSIFKEPNRPQISSIEPALSPGDIWIDSLRRQLYFNDGQGTRLAGPIYTSQQGVSGNEIVNLVDNTGITKTLIKLKIGDVLLGVFSKESFTPNYLTANGRVLENEGITGIIRKGFTPAITGFGFYGTASSAQNLIDGFGNVINVSNFVQTTGNSFINGSLTIINGAPLTLGASNNLTFEIASNLTSLKSNIQNSNIALNVKNASGSSNAIYIDATRSRVGIYNSDPLATFDVAGDANFRNNIVTNKQSIDIVNTTATTVNLAGAATAINIGDVTGTTTVKNNLNVVQNVNIDGGSLNSTLTNFNLFNTTVKTINMGAATTTINIGGVNTGIVKFKNDADVQNRLTVSGEIQTKNVLINGNTVRSSSGSLFLNANNVIEFEKDAVAREDLLLKKKLIFDRSGTPEIISLDPSAVLFNFLPNNIKTINFGGEATRINIGGDPNGDTYINHNLNVVGEFYIGYADSTPAYLNSKAESVYIFNTKAKTIFLGGNANNIVIGDDDGELRIRNQSTIFNGDIIIKGQSPSGGDNIADIRADIGTEIASIFNENIQTLSIGGSAFNVDIGNNAGKTSIKNNLEINGTLSINGQDGVGNTKKGILTVGQFTTEFEVFPEFVTDLRIGSIASQIKIGRIENPIKDQLGGTVYIQHDLNIVNDLIIPTIDIVPSAIQGAGLLFKDNKNTIVASPYIRSISRTLGVDGDIFVNGKISNGSNTVVISNAEIDEVFILNQGKIKSLTAIANLFVDDGSDIGVQVNTVNIGNNNTIVNVPGKLQLAWKIIKTNYDAVAGDRLLVDTLKFNNSNVQIANNIQIILPLTPNVGDEIRFVDKTGISTLGQLFIRRNGNLINADINDIIITTPGRAFNLVYTGATRGWVYDNA